MFLCYNGIQAVIRLLLYSQVGLGTSFITQCHVKSIIFSVVANLPVLGLLPLFLFYCQIIVIAELEMEG